MADLGTNEAVRRAQEETFARRQIAEGCIIRLRRDARKAHGTNPVNWPDRTRAEYRALKDLIKSFNCTLKGAK
ncbi:MAG: hypothetical protein GC182_09115 [Rhodopseudomonas sp.]|nr:hypothetical protein [Rhodopseudomonas sp.]